MHIKVLSTDRLLLCVNELTSINEFQVHVIHGVEKKESTFLISTEPGSMEYDIDLSELNKPVLSIEVENGLNKSVLYEKLFIENDEEFLKYFISKKKRPWSENVTSFVAFQVLKHFTGSPFHRASAFPVLAYKISEGKAFEVAHDDMKSLYAEISFLCKGISYHKAPRRNGQHLKLSCLCAMLHYSLFISDMAIINSSYEELIDIYLYSDNYFTLSFGLSKIYLLYAVIQVLHGEHSKLDKTIKLALNTFKKAVADLREEYVLINEIAVTQSACSQLIKLKATLGKDENKVESELKKAFELFSRLTDNNDVMYQNLTKAINKVEIKGL